MKHFVRSTLLALSLFSVPVLAGTPEEPPAPAAPAAPAADETITLRAGNSKSLNIPNVVRIALGDPDYADVKTMGGNVIRIDARKAGETTLIIWTSGNVRRVYRIVVK